MSLYDYQMSLKIAREDYPFYALLMAAMRQADSDNTRKFQAAWPEVWAELDQRYHAPAGLSSKESAEHVHWMAQTLHQAYHMHKPGTWQECDEKLCVFAKDPATARTILVLAHSTHGLHHTEQTCEWNECPKDICSSTVQLLEGMP